MSDRDNFVVCGNHGRTPSTFVCRHLANGYGCGFHDAGTEGDPWPDAWCDKCQAGFERLGEWTDENEPKLALLCTDCYEKARERNRRLIEPLRPGQLSVSDEEYSELVRNAHAWCEARVADAKARWRFNAWANWYFDAERRILRFYDDESGPSVVADATVIGSFSRKTNTWKWGWANEGYSEESRAASRPIQVFGEVRGIRTLSEAHWPAEEVDGWEVAQIAARLLDAEAIYRAPMEHLHFFMLLRNFRPGSVLVS